jgi:hypothetical protein
MLLCRVVFLQQIKKALLHYSIFFCIKSSILFAKKLKKTLALFCILQYNGRLTTQELKMLTFANAVNFATKHALANSTNALLTQSNVEVLLANTQGTTFANIVTVTNCNSKIAAKYKKSVTILKVSKANVMLCNNVNTNVYANAVMRSANALNTDANVNTFTVSETYYNHTNCYALVQHKQTNALYLYAQLQNSNSVYLMLNANNTYTELTKQEVAQYFTASNANLLLNPPAVVHNVTNNVTHNVKVYTTKLQNVVQITANKQTISV